jgi:enterobactin synthetase component D
VRRSPPGRAVVGRRAAHYDAAMHLPAPSDARLFAVTAPGHPGVAVALQPLAGPSPVDESVIAWRAYRFAAVAEPAPASALRVAVPESLSAAAPRRLASFLAGRVAGTEALRAAGHAAPVPPIGRDASGAPRWPAGWIGSIAHTDGECVAASARTTDLALLGVDCERRLDDEVAHEVVRQVAPECREGGPSVGTGLSFATTVSLVFSAKEALYKALYPSVGSFFGFEAAECVAIDAEAGRLTLRLRDPLPGGFAAGDSFALSYVCWDELVLTALALPVRGPAAQHAG